MLNNIKSVLYFYICDGLGKEWRTSPKKVNKMLKARLDRQTTSEKQSYSYRPTAPPGCIRESISVSGALRNTRGNSYER
jgi:hypothetical protein